MVASEMGSRESVSALGAESRGEEAIEAGVGSRSRFFPRRGRSGGFSKPRAGRAGPSMLRTRRPSIAKRLGATSWRWPEGFAGAGCRGLVAMMSSIQCVVGDVRVGRSQLVPLCGGGGGGGLGCGGGGCGGVWGWGGGGVVGWGGWVGVGLGVGWGVFVGLGLLLVVVFVLFGCGGVGVLFFFSFFFSCFLFLFLFLFCFFFCFWWCFFF